MNYSCLVTWSLLSLNVICRVWNSPNIILFYFTVIETINNVSVLDPSSQFTEFFNNILVTFCTLLVLSPTSTLYRIPFYFCKIDPYSFFNVSEVISCYKLNNKTLSSRFYLYWGQEYLESRVCLPITVSPLLVYSIIIYVWLVHRYWRYLFLFCLFPYLLLRRKDYVIVRFLSRSERL